MCLPSCAPKITFWILLFYYDHQHGQSPGFDKRGYTQHINLTDLTRTRHNLIKFAVQPSNQYIQKVQDACSQTTSGRCHQTHQATARLPADDRP